MTKCNAKMYESTNGRTVNVHMFVRKTFREV